eukprot:1424989-Prymnesium_polylepis.2
MRWIEDCCGVVLVARAPNRGRGHTRQHPWGCNGLLASACEAWAMARPHSLYLRCLFDFTTVHTRDPERRGLRPRSPLIPCGLT